ncbi:MAG: InlB B-repeat-containing protein [Anaeroplasma sp.]
MKKKIVFLVIILFASFIFLISCNKESNLEDIKINAQKTDFFIGDEYSQSGLLVTAIYKNGSTENVTEKSTINSDYVDFSTAGKYSVLVTFENITKAYMVNVLDPNEMTLKAIHLDTTDVKKEYLLNEVLSLDGLAIAETYDNSTSEIDTIRYVTDLSNYNIQLRDNNDDQLELDKSFEYEGKFKVLVYFKNNNSIIDQYEISVISAPNNVKDAIALGVSNKNLVLGGTSLGSSQSGVMDNFDENLKSYEYGVGDYLYVSFVDEDNNTHIKSNYVEHYSLDEYGNIFGLRINENILDDPNSTENPYTFLQNLTADNAYGLQYNLYSYKKHFYSAEGMLESLYEMAIEDPNLDLTERYHEFTTDTGKKKYGYEFSFGLLSDEGQNNYALNLVSVYFTLNEEYIVDYLKVQCDVYYNNHTQGLHRYKLTPKGEPNSDLFYDEAGNYLGLTNNMSLSQCMGRLLDGQKPGPYSLGFEITQYTGVRTKVNQYTQDNLYLESFDVVYEDGSEVINDIVDVTIGDDNIRNEVILSVKNMSPASAISTDRILIEYESRVTSGKIIINSLVQDYSTLGLQISLYYNHSTKTIMIRVLEYGEYSFKLVTQKISKEITLNVSYMEPKTLTPQKYYPNVNPNNAYFSKTSVIDTYPDKSVYFNAIPEITHKENPSFKASCLDSNAILLDCLVALGTEKVDACEFKSSVVGTYTIIIVSKVNSSVTTTLTINVLEMPDFTDKLNGVYYFKDNITANIVGIATFNPSDDYLSSGILSGTLTIEINGLKDIVSYSYSNLEFSGVSSIGEAGTRNGRVKLMIDDDMNILLSYAFANTINDPEKPYLAFTENCILSREKGTVTYVLNNGSENIVYEGIPGDSITKPSITYDGYKFIGWYLDEACTNEYTFNTKLTKDGLVLYAKWEEVIN